MTVRAKFKVMSVTESAAYGSEPGVTQKTVRLSCASGAGNESWSKWTPSGSIEMTITNPAALAELKIGESFYVDFTPAPAIEPETKPAT